MPNTADIGSKRLIGLAPDACARWVTRRTDVVAEEIIASEFQWVSRESDVLMRAFSPTEGHFLLLTEIQLRHDPRMPRRVHAYAALAEERYNLPVFPVVVTILPPPAGATIVERHEASFMGLVARRDYRALNLWEVDAEIALSQPVRSLLPFVPLLRGGNEERVVRRALTALRADEDLRDLEPLLAYFASFVLNTRLVRQIMRWDMFVLEESPFYQEIIEQAKSTELLYQVIQALEYRFGPVTDDVSTRLATLDREHLDPLVRAAWTDDSLATFLARLTP